MPVFYVQGQLQNSSLGFALGPQIQTSALVLGWRVLATFRELHQIAEWIRYCKCLCAHRHPDKKVEIGMGEEIKLGSGQWRVLLVQCCAKNFLWRLTLSLVMCNTAANTIKFSLCVQHVHMPGSITAGTSRVNGSTKCIPINWKMICLFACLMCNISDHNFHTSPPKTWVKKPFFIKMQN